MKLTSLVISCLYSVHLTWVVGFTNPGLDLGVVWHLISQFMLEAYRSRDGESILKALTWCFISPSVMHHTGILFIELPKDCYNARVRKISLCAPNTPWGFSLEDCPVCGSDGYLRVFKKTPLACRVLCKECNGEGLVTHPTHLRTSFLKQFYLKNKGVEYVQVPFPGSPPLSISKFSGMKGQINVQNVNLAFIFYPCYSFFTRCNRAQFVPKKKVAWHVHNLAAPSFFASERTEMVAWTLEIPIWSGFASIIQMLTREDAE